VAAYFGRTGAWRVGAVVVDHQLQAGSAAVARAAVEALTAMGLDPVEVSTVTVSSAGSGPEAAARAARYGALEDAARRLGATSVLLGHTLDDQAEQVLLGLARGSGTRSLAGIPARRGLFLRPFLGLRRAETLAICHAEGLAPWHDPANADPAFLRSRVRTEVMPYLEDALGPGIAESLHRSAVILGQDADYLDSLAAAEYARIAEDVSGEVRLDEDLLRALPPALRQRVLGLAVVGLGGSRPSFERLQAAEALLRRHGSAGPIQLAGKVSAYRQPRGAPRGGRGAYGKLVLRRSGS
jgi:tRNA(Ile)-lysidine synthase